MSHLVFAIPGFSAAATLAQVKAAKPIPESVQLSNSNFEGLWEVLGFSTRKFVQTDGSGDTMETTYHTTIHDDAPVGIYAYELEAMLDDVEDTMLYAEQIDALYKLVEAVNLAAPGDDAIIWIF